VVLDTPAGLHGKRWNDVMRIADRMLMPLQPSLFDIQATRAFPGRTGASTATRRMRQAGPGGHARGCANHRGQ
jgi:chromosome partitioning protein